MPQNNIGDDGYNYGSNQKLPLVTSSHNEGLQLLRRIRAEPDLNALEVILYTGSGVKEQAEAFGAILYPTTTTHIK